MGSDSEKKRSSPEDEVSTRRAKLREHRARIEHEDTAKLLAKRTDPDWGTGFLFRREEVVPRLGGSAHSHETQHEYRARMLIDYIEQCRVLCEPVGHNSASSTDKARYEIDRLWKQLKSRTPTEDARSALFAGIDKLARRMRASPAEFDREALRSDPVEFVFSDTRCWVAMGFLDEHRWLAERLAEISESDVRELADAWLDDKGGRLKRKSKLAIELWERLSGERLTWAALTRQRQRENAKKNR